MLWFCSLQAGFGARQHLIIVCIVTNQVKPFQHSNRGCIVFLQVFQLTAFFVRGPVISGEKFIISLERVMIAEDEVRGALLCVQDFVRRPYFTQRNYFSDSGVAMLTESAAVCDSITSSAVFGPWCHVETKSR